MIFEEKDFILRDGRTVTLKTPETADAEQMLTYIKTACGETEFLLRYPEEWESMTVESEARWVEQLRTSPKKLDIACYCEGRVIGNCELSFMIGAKTAHRAVVAIAILKEYWGQGIGSAFFCEMIAAATAYGAEMMELEFIEGNTRAQHLYEKFGFHIVASHPNAFKLKDGTYRSEYFMQKYLKQIY